MKVFVMQGAPGSGKSTWVFDQMTDKSIVLSADHFFYRMERLKINPPTYSGLTRRDFNILRGEGVYEFDPMGLGQAHAMCLNGFRRLLAEPGTVDQLFIDNTNIDRAEAAPYMAHAMSSGHETKLVRVLTPLDDCIHRNTHDVPQFRVEAMWHKMRSRNEEGNLRQVLPFWQVLDY